MVIEELMKAIIYSIVFTIIITLIIRSVYIIAPGVVCPSLLAPEEMKTNISARPPPPPREIKYLKLLKR